LLLAALSLSSASTPFKLVGYWEDWGPTPNAHALQNYTHINYAFLEASDSSCTLSPPDRSKIQLFHNAGLKVLGSVGGESMNSHWKSCEMNSLIKKLVDMVNQYDLDGIDIDYEIDPPNAQYVIGLSNGLRNSLPAGKLLTHVPENNLMDKGASYWNILQQCNGVDFISVQYYNDNPNPVTDPSGAIAHYKAIVSDIYKGDATKVVFGMCISECSRWNMNVASAATITKSLVAAFPTSFGGVMNWAENQGDIDGRWSAAVHQNFPKWISPDLLF